METVVDEVAKAGEKEMQERSEGHDNNGHQTGRGTRRGKSVGQPAEGAQSAQQPWPDIPDVASIFNRRSDDRYLLGPISSAYTDLIGIAGSDSNCFPDLVLTHQEVIWQQINLWNKRLEKLFRKQKGVFDSAVPSYDRQAKREGFSGFEEESHSDSVDDDEDNEAIMHSGTTDDDHQSADLFNLSAKDLQTLERDLEREEEGDDNDGNDVLSSDATGKLRGRKYRKTVVDDRFFRLAEMEEFLDREDKKDSSQGFFDGALSENEESGDDDAADYHYADFFDPIEDTEPSAERREKDRLAKDDVEKAPSSAKKKVRFVGDDDDDEDEGGEGDEHAASDDELDSERDTRVMLGAVDDGDNEESEFQKNQKKVRSKIAAIEEANLAPRSWELSGEVTAMERQENTMLEHHVAFDQAKKSGAIVTEDLTSKIEALIIQRIKDKAFDDVERKVREQEMEKRYRTPVEETMVKKSLAEVYEEQFVKAQQKGSKEEKEVEKESEVEKRMKELFKKLDALSHYRYIPPEIRPEVRIVSNVASMQKEEVGPMASTEDVLVAPEEVTRHVKGLVKGKEERNDTDRARERRKKRKMQREKYKRKRGTEETLTKDEPKRKQRKGGDAKDGNIGPNLKSTAFFKQLQESATNAVKKLKTSKVQKEEKRNSSAKYIL